MNIANWCRSDPKTAPVHSKVSGLYMISSISIAETIRLGYNDALMLDYQGNIAEATSSNIFLVIGGALCTPTPTCFLNSITRRIVTKIAKDIGIEVKEKVLTLDYLDRAEEVFLTETAVEILSVGSIEDGKKKVWQFKPGRVTNLICTKFKELVDNL